jgi:hypothetical protein
MNDELQALHAELDELKQALELERAERSALPRLLIPKATEISREVISLGQDFELMKAAVDARLTELNRELPEGIAEGLMSVVNDLLLRQTDCIQGLVTVVTNLDERLRAIEELIAPALRGECRLVAQKV